MSNPFDAATPHLIECYDANMQAYSLGLLKPNYPVPAIRYINPIIRAVDTIAYERWIDSGWLD